MQTPWFSFLILNPELRIQAHPNHCSKAAARYFSLALGSCKPEQPPPVITTWTQPLEHAMSAWATGEWPFNPQGLAMCRKCGGKNRFLWKFTKIDYSGAQD